MKTSFFNRPAFLVPIPIASVALLLHTTWRLHSQNEALRAMRAPTPVVPDDNAAKTDPAPLAAAGTTAEGEARLADLREQLKKETAARANAEAKSTELASKLPTKEGELTISLGRIEQMGQTTAKLVRLFTGEIGKWWAAGKELTPDDEREAMVLVEKHLVQMPELQRMEDEPREISRHHVAALKEIYGLDAATSERAAKFLEGEFARLKSEKLTVSQRTEADKTAWESRRDAAMTDLAARMRPLLPANHPQLNLLPGMLNLGEGFRTSIQVNPDGHGSMNMSLPLFPNTPRL